MTFVYRNGAKGDVLRDAPTTFDKPPVNEVATTYNYLGFVGLHPQKEIGFGLCEVTIQKDRDAKVGRDILAFVKEIGTYKLDGVGRFVWMEESGADAFVAAFFDLLPAGMDGEVAIGTNGIDGPGIPVVGKADNGEVFP